VAGEALSRALERAAEQLAGAPSTGDPSGTRRELERLTRDLDDAADACRRAPAACARSLEQLERALADGDRRPPGDRGAQATGRGEPTSPGDARAAFERAAQGRAGGAGAPAGERRQPGDRVVAALGAGGTAPRTSDGRAGRDGDGPSERATAAAAAATGSAKAQAVALGSDGPPGDGEGEAPLGRRSNATGGGFATALPDAPDGEGDGPLRAEAIASGASSGFAAPAYQRAWTEYARVAEELVESNAIPAHRRELVRRYFDLIRPRRGTP
jgi:hypothetical protein